MGRRGLLKRLLALFALAAAPAGATTATPPPLSGARQAPRIVGGWILTERDIAEIARLDR